LWVEREALAALQALDPTGEEETSFVESFLSIDTYSDAWKYGGFIGGLTIGLTAADQVADVFTLGLKPLAKAAFKAGLKKCFIKMTKRAFKESAEALGKRASQLLADCRRLANTGMNPALAGADGGTFICHQKMSNCGGGMRGGGKNASHANMKRRDVARERYDVEKAKLDELKKKSNKTPADKEALEKLERQVKHLKRKVDFTGEQHSQKAKGG
jgi:hypothetical protein